MTAKETASSKGGSRRSPNFPSISLSEALKKVEILHTADGITAVSTKVVLQHLGYGERLSGAAGRIIAALRQYGLIQSTSGDKYQVSDDAYNILTLSEESPIRKKAIDDCARRPAMFREVLAEYPERSPSHSALKDFLIAEKRFNAASVDTFIRAMKGTFDLAKLYDPEVADEEVQDKGGSGGDGVPPGTGDGVPQNPDSSVKPLPAGTLREVSSLPEGEAVLQWPANLSPEGVQDLDDWLTLVIKKLKRRYASSEDLGSR